MHGLSEAAWLGLVHNLNRDGLGLAARDVLELIVDVSSVAR